MPGTRGTGPRANASDGKRFIMRSSCSSVFGRRFPPLWAQIMVPLTDLVVLWGRFPTMRCILRLLLAMVNPQPMKPEGLQEAPPCTGSVHSSGEASEASSSRASPLVLGSASASLSAASGSPRQAPPREGYYTMESDTSKNPVRPAQLIFKSVPVTGSGADGAILTGVSKAGSGGMQCKAAHLKAYSQYGVYHLPEAIPDCSKINERIFFSKAAAGESSHSLYPHVETQYRLERVPLPILEKIPGPSGPRCRLPRLEGPLLRVQYPNISAPRIDLGRFLSRLGTAFTGAADDCMRLLLPLTDIRLPKLSCCNSGVVSQRECQECGYRGHFCPECGAGKEGVSHFGIPASRGRRAPPTGVFGKIRTFSFCPYCYFLSDPSWAEGFSFLYLCFSIQFLERAA